jgi:stage II sporulation protein D
MKKMISAAILLIVSVFALPALLAGREAGENPPSGSASPAPGKSYSARPMAAAKKTQASPPPPEKPASPTPEEPGPADREITVRAKIDGEIRLLSLDDYLYGVVAGEMPAMFPEEALKAQAVAARTFTLYRIRHAPHPNHPDADVCDSPNCCKAYLDIEKEKAGWGGLAEEYAKRYHDAVDLTDGEIVVYRDEPIMAVFHASSYASTERCADVWGEDLPYLQSVASPDEKIGNTVTHTVKQAREILKASWPEMALESENPKDWFGAETHSEGGGVMSMTIGGVKAPGSRLRSVLGLSSIDFTVSFGKNSVIWESRGYGHGVGLSQYGAKALANEGKNYLDILDWYYVGTETRKMKSEG